MHFAMLVPKSLDPAARGRKMPLPDPRPSEKIAKLFRPNDTSKDQPKDQKNAAATPPQPAVAQASTSQTAAPQVVPLPEPRPNIKPSPEHRHRYYRSGR
jgi:membrane-bound lytic murein transglycosylase A